jgi:hypothetical protein
MVCEITGCGAPLPLEVVEALAQLLERLWTHERRSAAALHAESTSSAAALAYAEAAMEDREEEDLRTERGVGTVPGMDPRQAEEVVERDALGMAGVGNLMELSKLKRGGAMDQPASMMLPLQVRVALVAGGALQPLWALFGRDRGEHIATLLMSHAITSEVTNESTADCCDLSGDGAHDKEGPEADKRNRADTGDADMNTLLDTLCGTVTVNEALALDPNVVKRSGGLFRFTSFAGGGARGRQSEQPPRGPRAHTVATLRGALRVIDWAGEMTFRGHANAMGMRGAVAAATLIARVLRRAAPASPVKESLAAALPARVLHLTTATLIAARVQSPGDTLKETVRSAIDAIVLLCSCGNGVCHTVLQACWGNCEDKGGVGTIEFKARCKLGVAAARALSAAESDGSAVEVISQKSAASLLQMVSCAQHGVEHASFAAATALHVICRQLSRRRDADTLCSLGAHTTLLDVLKDAVNPHVVPELLLASADALALGVGAGGTFSRTTLADRDGLKAALTALSGACTGGSDRSGTGGTGIVPSAAVASIRRLISIPTAASAAPVPIVAAALAKRLELLTTHGDLSTSPHTQIKGDVLDTQRQGRIQEMEDICTTLAILVGAGAEIYDGDVFRKDFEDEFGSQYNATAVVTSGAISGLAAVLGGAGCERWSSTAVKAVGAILQCVVQRTEYGAAEALAAGCIQKAEMHIAAPPVDALSRARAVAASRVMGALARTVSNPLALCVRAEAGHNTDSARMGVAAMGVLDALREQDRDFDFHISGVDVRVLTDQKKSRVHLATIARVALTAAWSSVNDTIAVTKAPGPPLEVSIEDALIYVLANDMRIALERAAALPLELSLTRTSMSPTAYSAAVTALTCLPVSVHAALMRRVGLHVIEAIIGTAATAAAAAEVLLATCTHAVPIGANNQLAALARVVATGDPGSIDVAVVGLVKLLSMCVMEAPCDRASDVDVASALTLLVQESDLSSAAIAAIKKGVMAPLGLMMRRPMGSRDTTSAAAAVQAMHVILQVMNKVDSRNGKLLIAPEIVLSTPTADDLVSIIHGTASGHFNDLSSAALGVVAAVARGDDTGTNRTVMLEAGVDRALIRLAGYMETSRPAVVVALLALCPGPDHHSDSILGLSTRRRFEMFYTKAARTQTHVSVVLSLLQMIGWCPDEAQPIEARVVEANRNQISAPQKAVEALVGIMMNDGPELVEELWERRDVEVDCRDVAAETSIEAGTTDVYRDKPYLKQRRDCLVQAEQRLDAWASHTHALLAGESGLTAVNVGVSVRDNYTSVLHPSIRAALQALSPQALSAVLTPSTAIVAASTMGIDALPAIVLLGGRCARAKDAAGLGETVKALAAIDVSPKSKSLRSVGKERPAVNVTALFEIEQGCATLHTSTPLKASDVARTMRCVLQTMITSGVVSSKDLAKCAIQDVSHHAQLALKASGAGKTVEAHSKSACIAIDVLCFCILSANDADDRRGVIDVATGAGVAGAAGMFMDVDAGPGAKMLTSLAAAGVGAEGDIRKSPAAAAADAACRAVMNATRGAGDSLSVTSNQCGVMSAAVAMIHLLDMRGEDGVAASEATQIIEEVFSAALDLLDTHDAEAEVEATGTLAAILAALTTAGANPPAVIPHSAHTALVRNGYVTTLIDTIGESAASSIGTSLAKSADESIGATARMPSTCSRYNKQPLWWMPGAAQALAELIEQSNGTLAITAAVEAIPKLISAVASGLSSNDVVDTARRQSILETMVVLFTASPTIINASAESGATEVVAKIMGGTRGITPSEVLCLMSMLLGNGAVPRDNLYPPVLGDREAIMTAVDGLSNSNAVVRAAAANIIRHAAADGAGALASAALLAAEVPEHVSRLLLAEQYSSRADQTPGIIDQLCAALVRMMTKEATNANIVSTEDFNDTHAALALTRSIVECDDGNLAEGLALCAAFAAYHGLLSVAPTTESNAPSKIWSWGGNSTLQPVVTFLVQTKEDGLFASAAAAAPLLVYLSLDTRVSLISAGAGPALVSFLGLSAMSSSFAEAVRRSISKGGTVPPDSIAYVRWLIGQIVRAATSALVDAAVEVKGSGAGIARTAQSTAIGAAATVGPLGIALATIHLLMPLVKDSEGTVAEEASAALAVEGLAAMARASFALRATIVRLGCASAILHRVVCNAQLRVAGRDDLSSAARHLLEAPIIAPDQHSTCCNVAGHPFAPKGGYTLLTVGFLCDLLKVSGGANYCEHPTIDEGQVKSLFACMVGMGGVEQDTAHLTLGVVPNDAARGADIRKDDDGMSGGDGNSRGEWRRCLQLAMLTATSLLSQAPHNHPALMEGDTPSALADLATDRTSHADVRLASLRSLDGMLGGGGMLSWRDLSESSPTLAQDDGSGRGETSTEVSERDNYSQQHTCYMPYSGEDSAPFQGPASSRSGTKFEQAQREEDGVRRACLMRILAASAGQLSVYDPAFLTGMWVPPSVRFVTLCFHDIWLDYKSALLPLLYNALFLASCVSLHSHSFRLTFGALTSYCGGCVCALAVGAVGVGHTAINYVKPRRRDSRTVSRALPASGERHNGHAGGHSEVCSRIAPVVLNSLAS